jgi:hypothetical protein
MYSYDQEHVDFHQWLYAEWWKQKTENMFLNLQTQEEMSYEDLYKLYQKHVPKTIYFNLYYTEQAGYFTREVHQELRWAEFEAVGNNAFIKTIKTVI